MLDKLEKTELNQISLTGIRALVLIGLLIVKPHSLEEIRKTFIDYKIMDESHSNDILRIDMNTIKKMGCEISRSSPKTNNKYVLTKHPFSFNIPDEELDVIKKVYNYIKQKADISLLIEYDLLFKKIANYVSDEKTKEAILGISVFKYYNLETINQMIYDCKHQVTIELIYQKLNGKNEVRKRILTQKFVFQNDKFYIYGFDLDKKVSTVLNLKCIKSILSKKFENIDFKTKQTKIKYTLTDFDFSELNPDEEIIESFDTYSIIEGTYYNDFLATQRILSWGVRCVVIEPEDFKDKIIEKIKEMRKTYGC